MTERLQNGAQTSKQVGNYNTYVGGRYVPLIDGEWDANKNYEPLTIVINQGNSYTSAQYVPKGVPLQENGPYWFKTGSFNGQISALENKVNINTQNISNLITLNNNTNKRIDRKYLFIADSFGDNPNGWTKNIPYIFPYPFEIQQKSGSGFTKAVPTYIEMLDLVEDPDSITNIVIQTAGNDQSSGDITEYVKTFVEKANTLFKNLMDIKLYVTITDKTRIPYKAVLNNIMNKFSLSSKITCPIECMSFIHNINYIGPDGLHLTAAGYEKLCKQICNSVVGGSYIEDIEYMAANVGNAYYTTWMEGINVGVRLEATITLTEASSQITLGIPTTNTFLLPANTTCFLGEATLYQQNTNLAFPTRVSQINGNIVLDSIQLQPGTYLLYFATKFYPILD